MPGNQDHLTFLYRGSLSFCNYSCAYCPFAKTEFDAKMLEQDKMELARFVEHLERKRYPDLSILFIPWGEALVHEHYQEAMIRLSRMTSNRMIVIQTNLSAELDWVRFCDSEKVSFWCSFHPSQTTVDDFLKRVAVLDSYSVSYCIGAVGHDDSCSTFLTLREKISPEKYLWINPLDDDIDAYRDADIVKWTKIDPLFSRTAQKRLIQGTPCRCGKSVFTIDGNGDIRRCPFIKRTIGNLYNTKIPLRQEACPNEQCNCFIGYIHWENEPFRRLYGDNPVRRIFSFPTSKEC